MLKDGMRLCDSCGRSTSGVECTNPGCQDAVTAERDALAAERDSLVQAAEPLFSVDEVSGLLRKMEQNIVQWRRAVAERDALADQLAALKKRVADAERMDAYPTFSAERGCYVVRTWVPSVGHYALLRLEDGE